MGARWILTLRSVHFALHCVCQPGNFPESGEPFAGPCREPKSNFSLMLLRMQRDTAGNSSCDTTARTPSPSLDCPLLTHPPLAHRWTLSGSSSKQTPSDMFFAGKQAQQSHVASAQPVSPNELRMMSGCSHLPSSFLCLSSPIPVPRLLSV